MPGGARIIHAACGAEEVDEDVEYKARVNGNFSGGGDNLRPPSGDWGPLLGKKGGPGGVEEWSEAHVFCLGVGAVLCVTVRRYERDFPVIKRVIGGNPCMVTLIAQLTLPNGDAEYEFARQRSGYVLDIVSVVKDPRRTSETSHPYLDKKPTVYPKARAGRAYTWGGSKVALSGPTIARVYQSMCIMNGFLAQLDRRRISCGQDP
ncbi:hypothetical protein BJV78DRAFT_1155591 [Lactifluus subvellereus]|nr:hypothetical protein BJV78DRAFT_1155591 [Lactifluus subvellereus]